MGAVDQPANNSGGLLGVLGNIGVSDRMKRMITAYVLTTTTMEVVRRTHRRVRARFVYTIAVPSNDDVYGLLHQRILALIPPAHRRSVVVRAMREGQHDRDSMEITVDSRERPRRLAPHMFYDSTREQAVMIDGRRVLVTLENEEPDRKDGEYFMPRRDRIVFTAYGAPARDAVLAFIADATDALNEPSAPRFYMPRWNDWYRRDDLVPRRLDTVILRPGQKEGLVDDLRRFLTGRASYERLGIPWHRGYLFHGPPGTGKTSLARALATELGIDLYYLPISDLQADTPLLQLVSSVPARSMLLLEDVDILHAAKTRDDEGQGVSLSGLLNALDGVATPAGLIVVMTTNNPAVLDDAITRPGRVDRQEKIGYLDDEQLATLVAGFFGEAVHDLPSVRNKCVAPADVAEVLKRYMGDERAQRSHLHCALVAL